jgi:hypothetical protein
VRSEAFNVTITAVYTVNSNGLIRNRCLVLHRYVKHSSKDIGEFRIPNKQWGTMASFCCVQQNFMSWLRRSLDRYQSHFIYSLNILHTNIKNTWIFEGGGGGSEERSSHVGAPKPYFACPSGTRGSDSTADSNTLTSYSSICFCEMWCSSHLSVSWISFVDLELIIVYTVERKANFCEKSQLTN